MKAPSLRPKFVALLPLGEYIARVLIAPEETTAEAIDREVAEAIDEELGVVAQHGFTRQAKLPSEHIFDWDDHDAEHKVGVIPCRSA